MKQHEHSPVKFADCRPMRRSSLSIALSKARSPFTSSRLLTMLLVDAGMIYESGVQLLQPEGSRTKHKCVTKN